MGAKQVSGAGVIRRGFPIRSVQSAHGRVRDWVIEMSPAVVVIWIAALLAGNRPARSGLTAARVLSGTLRGLVLELPLRERPGMAAGRYERSLEPTFRAAISPGSTVYAIGAHVGYVALLMAKLVGPTGTIVAFEANHEIANALERNLSRNRVEEVIVERRAVAAKPGTTKFIHFDFSFVGRIAGVTECPADGRVVEVRAVSLDHMVDEEGLPPPDFIQCTVTGDIMGVLQGMEGVIAKSRPPMIFVVQVDERLAVIEHMRARGYRHQELSAGLKMNRHGASYVLFTPDR